jgi:cytochrome c biogenesis protein
VYTTWWFLSLLILLSLISCTFTRQFPLLENSKEYFFKKRTSFLILPFSVKLKISTITLLKIQEFSTYTKTNVIYGYKGLIGRISPILVHLSLIIILGGSALGAFKNFKAQSFTKIISYSKYRLVG